MAPLGRPAKRFALVLLLVVSLPGCATFRADRLIAERGEGLPSRMALQAVPFHPQEAYHCGPATLAMALNWAGVPVDPEQLTPEVFTPGRQGTLQAEITTGARRHGRIAYPVSTLDDLLKEVAAGHPVIVFQNLGLPWYPRWHHAVVIGYDLPRREVLLHSGLEAGKATSMRLFELTWEWGKNWGLVVLPPEELPATAGEERLVRALVGLEKVGEWGMAARGYRAALARWPESYGALMGLGNSLYAAGDLRGAEGAFRAASIAYPLTGSAFNNLAQVLLEEGRTREALPYAMKAVEIGGPLKPVFLQTLEQIKSRNQ